MMKKMSHCNGGTCTKNVLLDFVGGKMGRP